MASASVCATRSPATTSTGPTDERATFAILRRSSASPLDPSVPIMWVPPDAWMMSLERATTCTSRTGSVASWPVSLSRRVPPEHRRPDASVVASTTATACEAPDEAMA